jgi:hypothetical protein
VCSAFRRRPYESNNSNHHFMPDFNVAKHSSFFSD